MTEGRTRLRATSHAVPGPGSLRRVLAPRKPPAGLWICAPSPQNLGLIVGSRAGLLHLGAWFRMAAISPHGLVHLPARGPRPAGIPWYGPPDGSSDLVIMRGDLGVRPSAWTGIRRRLRHGRPVTVRPPAPRGSPPRVPPYTRTGLVPAEYAETLLISGPPALLLCAGDVITAAGNAVAADPDVRRQGWALIDTLTDLLRDGGAAPKRPEIDVCGADPLFHRAQSDGVRGRG